MNLNNSFYTITDYLINIIEGVELNNTILFARSEDKDLYKNNLYPLTHINPVLKPLSLGNGNSSVQFEIGVLNQRLQDNKSENTSKKFNDYNLVDNFNITSAIINEIVSELIRDNGNDFIIDTISDATPIYYDDSNGLDGFVFNVTISIANNVNLC